MVDVSLPAVAPDDVVLFVFALLTGLCVPFRYGIERLRGFGRAALSRLPYEPPPEETADGRPVIEPDDDPEADESKDGERS